MEIPYPEHNLKAYGLPIHLSASKPDINLVEPLLKFYAMRAALPLLSGRMEAQVERMSNILAKRICTFAAHYLLASCIGEARHLMFQTRYGTYPETAEKLIGTPYEPLLYIGAVAEREASAELGWQLLPDPPSFTAHLLANIFLFPRWGTGYGGLKWGFCAIIAERVLKLLERGDAKPFEFILALDQMVHLIHNNAPLFQCSKLEWYSPQAYLRLSNGIHPSIKASIPHIIEFKAHAWHCCWVDVIQANKARLGRGITLWNCYIEAMNSFDGKRHSNCSHSGYPRLWPNGHKRLDDPFRPISQSKYETDMFQELRALKDKQNLIFTLPPVVTCNTGGICQQTRVLVDPERELYSPCPSLCRKCEHCMFKPHYHCPSCDVPYKTRTRCTNVDCEIKPIAKSYLIEKEKV